MKPVAVIGCGAIGQGWAILFAHRGIAVRLFDVSAAAAERAVERIAVSLSDLCGEHGFMGSDAVQARISVYGSMAEAVEGVFYVQECVPENVSLKTRTFVDIAALTDKEVILASSCSSILPDAFLEHPRFRERCIVAHPFSPPHLIPLVEIVTSSWTSEATVDAVRCLLTSIGQRPIVLRKPVPGYVVNRLQAAVIAESLALVREEVISPQDLDTCMKDGLGRRWAFMGPFQTMDLNSAGGFQEYVNKFYADGYRAICSDLKVHEPWSPRAIDAVEHWRREEVRDEKALALRRRWRDQMLLAIGQFLRDADDRSRTS